MVNLKTVGENFKNCLFYDIEVFSNESFVVFKDYDKKVVAILSNSKNEIDTEAVQEDSFIVGEFDKIAKVISNKVLIGFNNYYYDDYILTLMMRYRISQKRIKNENDLIITGFKPDYGIDQRIQSLDCFQQISVARSGLKKIEANMGKAIIESEVAFDIDRALTEDEYQEVIKYCCHDVDTTIDIFKLRWNSYFLPKLQIVDRLKFAKEKSLKYNTTTITASLLTEGKNVKKWNKLFNGYYVSFRNTPKDAVNLWQEHFYDKKGKVSVENFDCVFEFGFGGLHGVNKTRKKFENVKLLDVASMYPNILINLNVLGDATKRYQDIVDERIKVKHTDPQLQQALKLIINSTYGLLSNKYSKLFNPIGAVSVCVYGQIALYSLCERLYEAGYTLVNINTDGVAFCGEGEEYKEIWHEWEKDFSLTLELDEFKRWVQKDVNNYVAIDKEDHIKVKGKDVNKYYDTTDFSGDLSLINFAGFSWNNTNTLQIVSHCVVDNLLFGKDPIDTIIENLDKPIMFQMILQAGNTFKGTFDEYGRQYQKVNRIFPARKNGVTLKKKRQDGYYNRFPDTPNKMLVYNEDLTDFDNFSSSVDLNFYKELVMDTLKRWK